MPTDHSAALNAEAGRALKPLGLTRQGKSRVWIDDHGWWTAQVEFQPSAWQKGSYLNVGLNWLLYEGTVGSFNIGYRVDVPFVEATGNENFVEGARGLALRAHDEVEKLRARFSSLNAVLSHYREIDQRQIWDDYYFGVLLGLNGETAKAVAAFQSVRTHRQQYGWERAVAQRSIELETCVLKQEDFLHTVLGIVLRTRAIGNLSDWNGALEFR